MSVLSDGSNYIFSHTNAFNVDGPYSVSSPSANSAPARYLYEVNIIVI